MAAKPTLSNAEWATDATFSSGPDAGQATKVSAGAGVKAQGWRPNDALGFVGAWFNYWMHQIYSWMAYLSDGDLTGNHSITGELTMPAGSIDVQTGYVQAEEFRIDHASQEFIYLAPRTRSLWIPASEFVPGTGASVAAGNTIQFSAASAICVASLQKYLPSGGVVLDLLCRVNQNAGSSVAMSYALTRTTIDASPAFSDTPTNESTNSLLTSVSGDQLLVPTAPFVSAGVDKTADIWTLTITASDVASGGDPEQFYGARIQFTDPGPRNY